MWIRSQDKKRLINFKKIHIRDYFRTETKKELFMRKNNYGEVYESYEDKDSEIYLYSNIEDEEGYVLGKYSTKERALEVLDEIHNILMRNGEIDRPFVYQMPEE